MYFYYFVGVRMNTVCCITMYVSYFWPLGQTHTSSSLYVVVCFH